MQDILFEHEEGEVSVHISEATPCPFTKVTSHTLFIGNAGYVLHLPFEEGNLGLAAEFVGLIAHTQMGDGIIPIPYFEKFGFGGELSYHFEPPPILRIIFFGHLHFYITFEDEKLDQLLICCRKYLEWYGRESGQ